MEIREIFESKIKIEPKVMSIEVLFNNPERVEKTDYKPFYQRNYVWDDEKATYFIESILLGTEIPPLIYFKNLKKVEIIDGRQRYQTILRFINNEFKLKKNGLPKLQNIGIANNSFKDLDSNLQDLFWDTKLRIIEFSFHSKIHIDEEMEDIVKKEIFKRYNSGITPLKPTEIDSAFYFEDDLNSFFKHKLLSDQILVRDISNVLHFDKINNEVLLKKIRQLLVQHKIPIKYYAVKKNIIIAKFYEYSFSDIDQSEILNVYTSFIEKINLLGRIKAQFPQEENLYNRLISECLFWAFSIMEDENLSLNLIDSAIIEKLWRYIYENIESFEMIRSSFSKELFNRYQVISNFFANEFNIDFTLYLHNNPDFKEKNKNIDPEVEELKSFDELRINKPEPSSIAIIDICRQMGRNRFLIRPPYQRSEVINKKKSSSIIESILLGVKLPPIFVYKREDGISEVLDGQQRLLSILGFINEPYLDETNQLKYSDKNRFSLYLKNGILKNLHGKKFEHLNLEQKDKIKNFDLWIIEINYKNNTDFEPIDLFLRLNNKPYPIKEDTFEMWNSYISRDIILTIQSIYKNNDDWFYIRKNNSRMENENIYTALIYFQYTWILAGKPSSFIPNNLDIYKIVEKINFRVKSKNEITKTLEDISKKDDIIMSANEFEFDFLRKLSILVSNPENDLSSILNKHLEEILNVVKRRRTQQAFYALWYFLFDISLDIILKMKIQIRKDLKRLFQDMAGIESKEIFLSNVTEFKSKYSKKSEILLSENIVQNAKLENIAIISKGLVVSKNLKLTNNTSSSNPYFEKGDFKNFQINKQDIKYIADESSLKLGRFLNSKEKILLKQNLTSSTRLNTAYIDSNLIYKSNIVGIVVNRYGFKTKYVLAILFSRYCLNKLDLNYHNDSNIITISDLKAIEVPIVPIEIQTIFITLIDYILNSESNSESTLFFERLIDAMVYEIHFQNEFHRRNIKISTFLKHLPYLDSENKNERIKEVYKELSHPDNDINTNLLNILNVPEIIEIEKNF